MPRSQDERKDIASVYAEREVVALRPAQGKRKILVCAERVVVLRQAQGKR